MESDGRDGAATAPKSFDDSWIPFYEELADKILEFKDDREKLTSIIERDIIGEDSTAQKLDGENPFALFIYLNTQDTVQRGRRVKAALSMDKDLPEGFYGYPCAWYVDNKPNNEKLSESAINTLWALLATAIAFADSEDASADRFKRAYDKAISIKGIGPKRLSKWLFGIRPNTFPYIGFYKGGSCLGALKAGALGQDVKEYCGSHVDSWFNTGKRYLELTHLCLGGIADSKYDGIAGFVFCTWDDTGESESEAEVMQDDLVNEMTARLLHERNIVFHGAPGTGKTYLARQIAAQIIGCEFDDDKDELSESDQFGFVQFHPSYDYTDFVEGLRPVSDEEGNVGFELMPGTFMEFCDRARNVSEGMAVPEERFSQAWTKLRAQVENDVDEGYVLEPSKRYDWRLYPRVKNDSLIYKSPKGTELSLTKKWAYQYWINPDLDKHYKIYYKPLVNHLETEYGLGEYVQVDRKADDSTPFVFIIDEINRGDISKIFGELFFSIDPSYRGEKGKVKTQYSNLHDDQSEYAFNDWFYIPENVYIIGTMNDIDRSVDTFDYAMRRRFKFVEITAKDTQYMLEGKPSCEEAYKRMEALNGLIRAEPDLGSAYEIGASYFKDAAENGNFADLWDYSLGPLIGEYLRDIGKPGNGEFDKYKAAYDRVTVEPESQADEDSLDAAL